MRHIDLSSGASYFKSPDAATAAAIAALQNGKTAYGPTEGNLELRSAIASRYKKDGINLSTDQILITPGSKQALYNLFTVLLRESDEVIIPTPAWFGFQGLLARTKGKLISLKTSLSDNYNVIPEALQKVLSSRSRILVLTNPGNPTGRLYSKQELEAILEITSQYPDLYIVSDEIYDFVTYSKPFTSILSCQGAAPERTFVINGFSKTFAMSGWRIGYLAGPEKIVKKCTEFQSDTLSGVSLFIQDAAIQALTNKDQALKPMLETLRENRSIMQAGLEAIPDIRFYVPDGAYYFFPDLSFYFGSKTPFGETLKTSEDLVRYLLEHYSLQLSPGDYFGAPGHARMSFAVEKPILEEALIRLKQALLNLNRPV